MSLTYMHVCIHVCMGEGQRSMTSIFFYYSYYYLMFHPDLCIWKQCKFWYILLLPRRYDDMSDF